MITSNARLRLRSLALTLLLATTLFSALNTAALAQGYTQTNLVSDIPGLAAFTDPNLINPWGIALGPTSPFWVSDNGTGFLTLYNTAGKPQSLVVSIPPPAGSSATSTPTGQVFNGTQDFQVAPGKPGIFIACTEDGTISAWNPGVDLHTAVLKVDNSHFKAVYKGLTLANNGSANFLYVVNFHSGKIEVFDTNYAEVHLQGDSFKDPHIPGNYSPFNVQNIGGKLYVTFARRQNNKHDEVDGTGLGFVDVFTPDGVLTQRLESGWWFNAPWGVAQAPADFGVFSNALLVGNFGSGWIAAFNPTTGAFLGLMLDSKGAPIFIDGLWALTFGNGAAGGAKNKLYFTAGLNGEQDGLFGSLQPTP
jgi:uncharacterized protein (TIGR03118 family)